MRSKPRRTRLPQASSAPEMRPSATPPRSTGWKKEGTKPCNTGVPYVIGLVVERWMSHGGHYPPRAYKTAFALNVGFQVVALAWFTGRRAWPVFAAICRDVSVIDAPLHLASLLAPGRSTCATHVKCLSPRFGQGRNAPVVVGFDAGSYSPVTSSKDG